MVNQSIIDIANSYVHNIPISMGVKKAYLFGSYAKQAETENSDIDIAVVVDTKQDFFELQMELMRLRRKYDLRIEPHPIFDCDFNAQNPLAYDVQQTGIELK